VYHCHILSHEEMDMMRPVSVALPPIAPNGLAYTINGSSQLVLTWNDNSINETSFLVQRTTNGTTWTDLGTVQSPLNVANTHGTRSYTDTTYSTGQPYLYRVVARNTVGYGAEFPSLTAQSVSASLGVNMPAAPTNLVGTLQSGPKVSLTWKDNATNETGFVILRSADSGVTWTQVGTAPPKSGTGGSVTYVDTSVPAGATYQYKVGAVNVAGTTYSNTITVVVPPIPLAPTIQSLTAVRAGTLERVTVTWSGGQYAANFQVQLAIASTGPWNNDGGLLPLTPTSYTTGLIARRTWWVRVGAINASGTTWSTPASVAAAP
jgi:hypothetical protein